MRHGNPMAAPALQDRSRRLAWLDYSKAVGIALVVFGHASLSVERTPSLVSSDALAALVLVIYEFHMPLFFVLAGCAAALQARSGRGSFAASLAWGLVVPYVIWSALWIATKAALPGFANTPLGLGALIQILWVPVDHFWFLYDLIVIRVLWQGIALATPWLLARAAPALQPPAATPVLAMPPLATLAIAGALAAISVLIGDSGKDPGAASHIVRNAALYGLGLLLPGRIEAVTSTWRSALGAAAAAAALFAVVLAGVTPSGSALAALLTAVLGSLTVLCLARALPEPETPLLRFMAFAGEATLALYLIHPFLIGLVRAALAKAGMLSEANLVLIGTLAGLLGSLAIYMGLMLLAARSGRPMLRWLGLGSATGSKYLALRGGLLGPPVAANPSTKS